MNSKFLQLKNYPLLTCSELSSVLPGLPMHFLKHLSVILWNIKRHGSLFTMKTAPTVQHSSEILQEDTITRLRVIVEFFRRKR